MRAQGRLYELGDSDLALEPKEAAELLRRSGVELLPTEVEELTARTEGWAAGLYLAALAMQSGSPDRPPVTPHGSHPYLAEYFRSEVLDQLPPEEVAFLVRTSVLDRLTRAAVRRRARDHRLGELAPTSQQPEPVPPSDRR